MPRSDDKLILFQNNIQQLTELALQSDIHSQLMLAKLYLQGSGVPKNLEHGITWLEMASALGSEEAKLLLGCLLTDPLFPYYDLSRGRSYFETLALKDHRLALLLLGYTYLINPLAEQIKNEQQSQQSSKSELQCNQGRSQSEPQSTQIDSNNELPFCIGNNNNELQSILGNKLPDSKAAEQCYVMAKNYFDKALKLQEPKAYVALGWLYLYGCGVPIDYQQALSYLELGIQHKDAWACFYMSKLQLAVKQNSEAALLKSQVALQQGALLENIACFDALAQSYSKQKQKLESQMATVIEDKNFAEVAKYREGIEFCAQNACLYWLFAAACLVEQNYDIHQRFMELHFWALEQGQSPEEWLLPERFAQLAHNTGVDESKFKFYQQAFQDKNLMYKLSQSLSSSNSKYDFPLYVLSLKASAMLGSCHAQSKLGEIYLNRSHILHDVNLGLYWLKESLENLKRQELSNNQGSTLQGHAVYNSVHSAQPAYHTECEIKADMKTAYSSEDIAKCSVAKFSNSDMGDKQGNSEQGSQLSVTEQGSQLNSAQHGYELEDAAHGYKQNTESWQQARSKQYLVTGMAHDNVQQWLELGMLQGKAKQLIASDLDENDLAGDLAQGNDSLYSQQAIAQFDLQHSIDSDSQALVNELDNIAISNLENLTDGTYTKHNQLALEQSLETTSLELFKQGSQVSDNQEEQLKTAKALTLFLLGEFYASNHKEHKADYEQALKFLTQAAELGSSKAILRLADMYLKGQGVACDKVRAIELLKQAEGRGCIELGRLYLFGRYGVEKDFKQSLTYFLKAYEEYQCYEACSFLGYIYEFGLEVAKDLVKAATYYEVGEEHDQELSGIALANLHFAGVLGKVDYIKARQLYQKYLQSNNPLLLANLGWMLVYGKGGSAQPEYGVELLSLAAAQDSPQALYWLGMLLLQGRYIKQNIEQGMTLLKAAASLGDVHASDVLEQIQGLHEHEQPNCHHLRCGR